MKGLSYSPLEIIDIYGKDLLPQVEKGDLDVYDHIDHIRVGETTRVIDMMWEYGAGGYTPQQYQQLMGRLNTGLLRENPKGTDEYVIVGGRLYNDPSEHAYVEWSILTSFIKHATIIVIDTWYQWEDLYELCKSNPDKINIMGLSK